MSQVVPPGRRRTAGAAVRVCAAALALAVLGCSGAARRLEEATDARRAGRAAEALGAYQDVLAELGEGHLGARDADLRLRALQHAADVCYLELGEYTQAVAYYRRIVALYRGTDAAWRARARAGDIYRQRFGDRVAAIAQWAEIAASDAAQAPEFQLKVAREYLDLKNGDQARTEARALRDRWPTSPLADEAQLLTAHSWAVEGRADEAQRAYAALLARRPAADVAARALEGQAHLAAADGRLDRALELYAEALPAHPRGEAIRREMERLRARRDRTRPARAGDRVAVFGALARHDRGGSR